ncbi:MAG: acyl-[acyl-carrier-protein]--UDP-N-acetylglucosamine O-acyltransferase [Fimbriimonadales bacterium]|nr:MAG: acyl-[acyl-carrier-protein]--UDP-N-acetylglucosamine O-acyltransferase [Fimbriimonadales bacterium]
MATIHPTAVVHPTAEIDDDVEIGPYSIVGAHVRIGAGTTLGAHVIVEEHTHIGRNNMIYHGAVLGAPPQDRKFKHERSFLHIGEGNWIREYVTIHRASGEGQATRIGDHCFLMAYVHIGHNCTVGNGVVMANSVGVSGHCEIGDGVNLGGMAGIHQFTRIGTLAMVGGMARIVRDVPPFMIVEGSPAEVRGVNIVGLRRAGAPEPVRDALRKACRWMFFSELNMSQAIEKIQAELEMSEELNHLLKFMEQIRNGRNGRALDRPTRK